MSIRLWSKSSRQSGFTRETARKYMDNMRKGLMSLLNRRQIDVLGRESTPLCASYSRRICSNSSPSLSPLHRRLGSSFQPAPNQKQLSAEYKIKVSKSP